MKFILTSLTFLALIASSTQAAKENPQKLKSILGDDLSGWKVPAGNDKANWYTVKDGVLVIQSGPKKKGSVLWTEKKFKDFIVELDFRFGEGTVDSGVHVRNRDQIQIGISGSLKRDMTCSPYIPGKGTLWRPRISKNFLRPRTGILCVSERLVRDYTVWLQGEEVMNYESSSAIEEGPIGIQLHGNRNMGIDYRNIKVTEL